MEVAHSSRALLQIWLLEKNRGREFAVTCLDIGTSFFEETCLVPDDAVLAEALCEFSVKGFVPAEPPMVKERGPGDRIMPGFRYAFGNGAGSVADLEPEIEKRVEDVADQFLLIGMEIVGGLRKEKEEVYVGSGIKQSPSVAAIGYQRE